MAPFKSIFQPSAAAPKSLVFQQSAGVYLRDQFPLSTWLLLGASLQALISILLPKTAIYLSTCLFAILAYYLANTMLQVYGVIPNPEMARVIPGKASVQLPDLHGNMPSTEPTKESVVVMFLSSKSNHPLRMLAPGFKEVGDYFQDMMQSLDNPEGREKYGFLGMSSYLGSQSASSNELLSISYWRNIEGIHAFAESPVHRVAWDYWNQTVKKHPYLLISHEIYRAEGTQHENIYINAPPTLIGGTAFPVKTKQEQEWLNPLVEANKGVLATSNGRLGRRPAHK
ncbi:hypothetical protein UA08_06041 [Talaromyces atroroseus]|uniref:Uncharacterized protein n=1 Tax=Talaromyces atroroseus TaxID=1441469 RepID=A0A225ASZ0_TALAT|nr:hypothetical protein UA08_06041 [Talaromyces atroroseus]OKL58719.1 hypothetical protein UA08_06041 [Talaromyces atroroseus]